MKPIEFPEQNAVLAKDQPEYTPLPVLRVDEPEGRVISVWELSANEVELIGRTRKLYFSQMTFGKPPMPIFLSVFRGDLFQNGEDAPATIIGGYLRHNVSIKIDFWDRLKILLTGEIDYFVNIDLDRHCHAIKDDGGNISFPAFDKIKNMFRRKRKADLMAPMINGEDTSKP